MINAMGESQYFTAQDEQRTVLKETGQESYITELQGDLVEPEREPPQPPKRPQDIETYFNNLLKELGEIYIKQFNRELPPGLLDG